MMALFEVLSALDPQAASNEKKIKECNERIKQKRQEAAVESRVRRKYVRSQKDTTAKLKSTSNKQLAMMLMRKAGKVVDIEQMPMLLESLRQAISEKAAVRSNELAAANASSSSSGHGNVVAASAADTSDAPGSEQGEPEEDI